MKMSEIVEEGFNFLHVEASKILAFIATDSDRAAKPCIPPHIPIAYGLHGSAMSMETMQNMIKDLRKELHDCNCTVLCEVYDGQFHQIIVKSEDGHPLTRLQLSQNHFKTKMNESSQQELLNILLPYSSIDSVDITQICKMRFVNGDKNKLNSVCIEMKRYLQDDTFFRKVSIATNKVGNFSMEDIVTRHRYHIWNKYLAKYPRLIPEHEVRKIGMSAKDVI